MQNKTSTTPSDTPNPFVAQHQSDVIGVLSGLDRLRFKGTLPALYYPKTMECYLSVKRLMFKEFKDFALGITRRIKAAAMELAEKAGRPFIYLRSSNTRKETQAKDLVDRDGLQEGLIGVFGCVESCRTYYLAGNRQTKKLEFKLERGKCQHFYFYHLHPEFGLMHMRLQSWFPFQVEICLNGRHWLARQMNRHKMDYVQKENCFPWISHLKGAQRLMDKQLQLDWPEQLNKILQQNHPLAGEICRPLNLEYYWTTQESEYATDVMFGSSKSLSRIYPSLVRHGITSFSSGDVMRFLGHRVCANGEVRGEFKGELISDYKKRPEGVRVKHSLKANSIKVYDKQGSILRVETTINDPSDFRVFREPQVGRSCPTKEEGKKSWLPMRRGVADLKRRAEVSLNANNRYLTALAAIESKTPLHEHVDQICKPIRRNGSRARALNPWAPADALLLQSINRGEFKINGFRNRDLRALLFKGKVSDEEQKRRAGKVTRKLALLRAHGLVKRISGTHRYVLTEKGSKVCTSLLAARNANINDLTAIAV